MQYLLLILQVLQSKENQNIIIQYQKTHNQ